MSGRGSGSVRGRGWARANFDPGWEKRNAIEGTNSGMEGSMIVQTLWKSFPPNLSLQVPKL
jgi:hypothetical protein